MNKIPKRYCGFCGKEIPIYNVFCNPKCGNQALFKTIKEEREKKYGKQK